MKEQPVEEKTCPLCGKMYRSHSAISRADNTTPICPDCGIREALEALGCSEEEREHILQTIHEYTGGRHDQET